MDRSLVTSRSPKWPIVAATANSHLVRWQLNDCGSNALARTLPLRADFVAKGDNRGRLLRRQCVCRPYSVVTCGSDGVVADSGNNCGLLWRPATGIAS